MSKTVLITIGRLPKALDFARSFAAAGWRVLVAEPFKRHLTGASNTVSRSFIVPPPSASKGAYLQALARIIAEEQVELVLPLSEETMHLAHLPALLANSVRVFAPPPAKVLELHDKAAFIALAARHGLAVPETTELGSEAALRLAAQQDYVIKPIFPVPGAV
jgi:glutathione synthase/RimK-type ligase-like ATP-grasp enzyme